MKTVSILAGLLLLAGATGTTVMAKDLSGTATTTRVQNGGNSAVVTQSGPPGEARRTVARGSGFTRIEQHSGRSSAVIVQDNNPGSFDWDEDWNDVMPALKPRANAAHRTNADVYGAVRERSSPQSRKNLDRLMDMLGISNQR